MKVLFTIYVELESLLENANTCHNNPKKSSTTKVNQHAPFGYSLFTQKVVYNKKINSITIEAKIV